MNTTQTTWTSKTVDQFREGDRIRLYGWPGRVAEVDHRMVTADKDGYCTTNPKLIAKEVPCTYLRVHFDDPGAVGYQYEDGWYGGLDGVVAYDTENHERRTNQDETDHGKMGVRLSKRG